MKKIISLLLSLLMITGMLVMSIDTASAASSINFLRVKGVNPPVPGEHPDYSSIMLETEPRYIAEIADVNWVDKDYNLLGSNYTFVEGEKYYIIINIRPESGYCFEYDEFDEYIGVAEINNLTVASASPCGDTDMLFLMSDWVVAEEYNTIPITSVKITGLEAVAGGVCGFPDLKLTTVPEDAAEFSSIGMFANCVSERDTFIEGEEYKIFLELEPKYGYYFEFDDDGYYNGEIEVKGLTVPYGVNGGGTLYIDCPSVTIGQYVPEVLTDSQFLMYVDEVYTITNRGILLTGRVLNGRVDKSDIIFVTYYDGTNCDGTKAVTEDITAAEIHMYGKSLDYAEKGDYVGILIGKPYGTNEDGSINKGNLEAGVVLQGIKDTIPPVTEMVGTFKMLSTEEGGRKNPIEQGFRPQAYVSTSDVSCTFLDLNGGAIQPGETRKNVKLGDFYHGVVVYKGQEILIKQAGRTIGTFTVGETGATTYGDVDLDGVVSITDATYIQMHLAKLITLNDEQLAAADTDADGKVSITDATYIQMYLAKLIDHLG